MPEIDSSSKIANFCFLEKETLSKGQVLVRENFVQFKIALEIDLGYFDPMRFLPEKPTSLPEAQNRYKQMYEDALKPDGSNGVYDLILECRGEKFHVHKSILCYASESLRKRYNGSVYRGSLKISKKSVMNFKNKLATRSLHRSTEKTIPTDYVTDLGPEALREVLYFAYLEQPSESLRQHAAEVVHGANKYGLTELKYHCERELIGILEESPESKACEFLVLAHKYGLEILKMVAINATIDHIDSLTEKPEYNEMHTLELTTEIAREASQRLKVTALLNP